MKKLYHEVLIRVFTPNHKKQGNPLWRTVGFPSSKVPHLNTALNEVLSITVVEKIQDRSMFAKSDILRITGIQMRNYSRRCSDKGKFPADKSQRIARFVRAMDYAVDFTQK
ncbi:hypothetical protein [Photorhabdus sp. SF281]|uniref:hypothetical protein n=1 Tax=Photorhabdus sp. SF281 TaxID=3459527 RepID=UPI0040448AA7